MTQRKRAVKRDRGESLPTVAKRPAGSFRWRSPSGPRIRFYSSASDAARARRPTDVLLLTASVASLALATFADHGPDTSGDAISRFVAALSGLFDWFWELSYDGLLGWALVIVAASLVGKGRLSLLRDQLAAACLILGALLVASDLQTVIDGLGAAEPPPIFPAARVAFATALIVTTAPHLGRPIRRVGRWVVAVGAVATIALGGALWTGILAAVALGYGVASIVHLTFGSPGGRPTQDEIVTALRDLGIDAAALEPAELEARGVVLVRAVTTDGRSLLVKVYGRDAWDGQLLITTWSYLWYRDDSPTLTLNRLQQVEHEAFVTLLAERARVPVLPVVAAGMSDKDALLVLDINGRSLRSIASEDVTDDVLRELWRAVLRMHAVEIAHGALDADHLSVLAGGTTAIGDFGNASAVAATELLQADRAQLLVTCALLVGGDRAVRVAVAEIGTDGLFDLLPYIQTAALTRASRKALRAAGENLNELRNNAAAVAGRNPPKLVPLRRVTAASLVRTALLLVAASLLVSGISGLGVDTITDELLGANGAWLMAALVVAQVEMIPQAFSTLGASLRPLRFGPVVELQFAIRFVALVLPSTAARVATNIRFFQRVGASSSTAIVVGALDGAAGFVIQVVLLLVIGPSGLASLSLSIGDPEPDIEVRFLLIAAIVALVAVGVTITVPKYRRMLQSRLSEAAESLRVLRSPTKLVQLFGGNLTAQIVAAITLGFCLITFGEQASLAELILVNTAVSLFAGLLPVPGGIGVSEAALTAGLVALGVPESSAFATALTYRLVTYYLPPIWGWFAMRALKQQGYL
jgi:uncharacterized membrane protein YbhN (UPF0104 family)/tRNA A-37 threonylcarbamoyl transferase component Bud32